MEDKDYLIEEYKTLRQEILQKQIIAVSYFVKPPKLGPVTFRVFLL